MSKAEQDIRRKLRVFEYAERTGNIRKTCRHFGMPRSLFYPWRKLYSPQSAHRLIGKRLSIDIKRVRKKRPLTTQA